MHRHELPDRVAIRTGRAPRPLEPVGGPLERAADERGETVAASTDRTKAWRDDG
ncbi:hypothetical protein [Halopiger goleimassiliensis]|uniref:hypothetical protein n=1 Tax=Halopiger goleimassiliensis TaxID=1293048 RepID=UPI000A667FE3|nr:hypothetical protein [Halopiger goleimassiliensis]